MSGDFGMVEASRNDDGSVNIHRADDVIQVTGELAQMHGVKPPLDGRIELAPGFVYDLSDWVGQASGARIAGTYIGRRVES